MLFAGIIRPKNCECGMGSRSISERRDAPQARSDLRRVVLSTTLAARAAPPGRPTALQRALLKKTDPRDDERQMVFRGTFPDNGQTKTAEVLQDCQPPPSAL
jgi:hypothetical protein